MRLLRSSLLALALAVVPAVVTTSDAQASVMIAVPFESLVQDADAVAVATPQDARSVWEDGRIYTYTRMKIDQGVAGDTGNGETWVRTMGGVVGKIGQLVDGEPVFTMGKQNMLFLRRFKAGGTWEISARAQGQFPVVLDDVSKTRKVIRSSSLGVLLPPKKAPTAADGTAITPQALNADGTVDLSKIRFAKDVLHDRTLDDATKEVASTWKKLHPATVAK